MKFKSILLLVAILSFSCKEDDENINGTGNVEFSSSNLMEVENATSPLNVNVGVDSFNHSGGTVSVEILGADYGVDYETSEGSNLFDLTIDSQGLVSSFNLQPLDNDTIDGNKTLTINLTSTTGALALGDATSLTFTIIDNDDPLISILSFENATTTIQENAGVSTVLNVLFDQPTTDGGTVTFTATGLAVYGTDYSVDGQTTQDFTITVTPGATSASFAISPIDNAVFEADKDVTYTMSAVTGGLVLSGNVTNTITIENDDAPPAPVVDFTNATVTYNEDAGTVAVNFAFSGTTTADATIELTTSGTAVAADYNFSGSNTNPYSFAIPAGSSTGTLNLTIIDDADLESDETIVLDITSVTGGLTAGLNIQSSTLTIIDNDNTPLSFLENFETITDLTASGFETLLNGQTVDPTRVIELINSGGNFSDENDFNSPSDNGLNMFYNAGAGATTELLDNVLVSPVMTYNGMLQMKIDNSYAFKNQNNATVTYYYSETYTGSGTFNEAEWTVLGTETVTNMDGEGFGNNAFKQQSFDFSASGNFYVAIRVSQTIDASFYRTRWRFDNLRVNSL